MWQPAFVVFERPDDGTVWSFGLRRVQYVRIQGKSLEQVSPPGCELQPANRVACQRDSRCS